MRLASIALLLLIAPTVSQANERPANGPVPGWVQRLKLPATSPGDQKPTRVLLSDEQVRFERDGTVHRFNETAIQIQEAEGLSAGTIAFAWRPEMDDITVHELKLVRGSKVIDVLASGKSFTVLRRETDLEAAKLDGILTATLQVDGVEVGDIIVLATTITTKDPVLGSHVETIGGTWNGFSVERAHLRMEWPKDRTLRLRSGGALPSLATVQGSVTQSVELSLSKLEPEILPKGAPGRFQRGRFVEASDFRDWSDISDLLAPHFAKASVIGPSGSLREEVNRIKRESQDPAKRTEAALRLVQDKIRYVAIQMGANGLVPASAEATWASRYGDCKAKTALLLALLSELGVQGEPVLVSAGDRDGLDARLPLVGLFDHVLVRANVGGRTVWLDGTRSGDLSLALLDTPHFRWGLPLRPKAQLIAIRPEPPTRPLEQRTLQIDARNGVYAPAPAKAEIVYRGDAAKILNAALNNVAGEQRNQALEAFWKQRFDDIEPSKVSAQYDEGAATMRFSLEGTAKLDWSDGFWRVPWSKSGYKADFSRPAGPNRDAPFELDYPSFVEVTTSIQLPPGVVLYSSQDSAPIDQTLAGVRYQRRSAVVGGVLKVERSERSLKPEISYSEAQGAQAALRALDKRDLYLRLSDYVSTKADAEAQAGVTPVDADGYVSRGLVFLDTGKFDEAVADFTRAHELDPKNPWALANRGLTYAWKKDVVRAKADFAATRALDPNNPVVLRGEAVLQLNAGDMKAAAASLTGALQRDPDNSWALGARAEAYRQSGEYQKSLADSDKLLALGKDSTALRLSRANIYRALGDRVRALNEAKILAESKPDDSEAQVTAAMILASYGDRAGAMQRLDRALAIKPEAYIYLNRYRARSLSDVEGRRADLEQTLKLDPTLLDALVMQGNFLVSQHRYADAIAFYNKALAQAPDDLDVRVQRGIAYARAGNKTASEADFGEARKRAKLPVEFNQMCWAKATAGVDLEEALADCGKALALVPESPAYLDSRALVLFRLGRIDEALSDYNKALAKAPKQAASLLGRSLIHARKGDSAKAEADRANAIAASPFVVEQFAEYGLTAP